MKENDTHELKGLSENTRKTLELSRQALQVPDDYFVKEVILPESTAGDHFNVPADYFERKAETLFALAQEQAKPLKRGKLIRMWFAVGAAAILAGIILMLLPNEKTEVTFSEQLQQSELEFEDLEQLEFEEGVLEELILPDTLGTDTLSSPKITGTSDDFKPFKGQAVMSWEEIEAEDIEEYLNDEETLEIIDEL